MGEVRWATTGFGVSWKLSGGSEFSAGTTNVSKKRQVRRAMRRSACDSASLSAWLRSSAGGWLARSAIAPISLMPDGSVASYPMYRDTLRPVRLALAVLVPLAAVAAVLFVLLAR